MYLKTNRLLGRSSKFGIMSSAKGVTLKKFLKWLSIIGASLVVLFLIVLLALPFYMPDSSRGWIKLGIDKEEVPEGINSSVVFENVTVIPMDSDQILKRQTVVVNNKVIAEIGDHEEIEIPPDAHVVDGEGKFLIPGLSDMHTHNFGSENDLLVYLASGVTTIRDLGGGSPVLLDWRDEIREGNRVGPTIFAWWPLVETSDEDFEWGAERAAAGGKRWIHTPEEAEQLVAEMADLGVDGIKAHGQPEDVFVALQKAAAEYELPFEGHVPTDLIQTSTGWKDYRALDVFAVSHV